MLSFGNCRKDAQQFENDNQLKTFHSHYVNDLIVSGATFDVGNVGPALKTKCSYIIPNVLRNRTHDSNTSTETIFP